MKRVAASTIRGFLSQILHCSLRWLEIGEDEVLITEGNEDVDVHVVANGRLTEATEESIKDLAGKISARDEAVYETFANFVEAFYAYDAKGVPCRLVFTTTAARANQRVGDNYTPPLDFDVLTEWSLFLSHASGAKSADELFDAVVKVIRAKVPTGTSSTLDAALLHINWKAKERFLRAVEWNFSAAGVEDLQAELLYRLRKTHGGNIAKAGTLAEAIVAKLWNASASSSLPDRTLRRSNLDELVGTVSDRFEEWQRWEAMDTFTSWASWNADHFHIGFVENEKGTCGVLGVNFRPMMEEAIIEDVWLQAFSDPVVSNEARELLRQGRRCEAFRQDAVLRIRLLDAVRQTDLQFYVVVSTDGEPANTIKRVVKLRAGTKGRRVLDIAAETLVFDHQPRLKRLQSARPAIVALLSCIALDFQRWRLDNHPDAERVMRWIAPRMRLLVDEQGEYHPSDSVLWERLRQ